jgi:hypothetical protein
VFKFRERMLFVSMRLLDPKSPPKVGDVTPARVDTTPRFVGFTGLFWRARLLPRTSEPADNNVFPVNVFSPPRIHCPVPAFVIEIFPEAPSEITPASSPIPAVDPWIVRTLSP